jgi:hypothetical protein
MKLCLHGRNRHDALVSVLQVPSRSWLEMRVA